MWIIQVHVQTSTLPKCVSDEVTMNVCKIMLLHTCNAENQDTSTSTKSSSIKYLLQVLSTNKPCSTSENDFIYVKAYNKMSYLTIQPFSIGCRLNSIAITRLMINAPEYQIFLS